MAVPKRTEFEAERDREIIARLYLRGVTQQSIADELNEKYYKDDPLSRQMISYDVRLIIERWEKAAVNHIDRKKAIELAKLDRLENEYWDAWMRSQQNAETVVERETPKGSFSETRSEGQSGNPAFLDGVLKCIDKRCEILGMDAPKRIQATIDVTKLSDEDLSKIAEGKDVSLD